MEVQNHWYNVHWYRVGEHYRQAFQELAHAIQPTGKPEKQHTPPTPDYDLGAMKQMDLGL